MDRAAKLAATARAEVLHEEVIVKFGGVPENARAMTRRILLERARHLGFAPNEISAAVDQALTDAGTTP
jgi:hypothetical protein